MRRASALFLALILILGASAAFAEGAWTCPACGRSGNTGQFCPDCGSVRPPDTWTCPACGRSGNEDRFCPDCGAARPDGSSPAVTEAPPAATAVPEPTAEPAPEIQAGQHVLFGHYEQDKDQKNGPEPIEWLVLECRDGNALLLSVSGLKCIRYNSQNNGATWADSSLRTWMNGEFLGSAFTEDEQSRIQYTEVPDGADQGSASIPAGRTGSDTVDRVFALSCAEMERYIPVAKDRLCVASASTRAEDCNLSIKPYAMGIRTSWFWLRSPAYTSGALAVSQRGQIEQHSIAETHGVARPALWVSTDGLVPMP